MRARRLIAAGVLTAATFSSTIAGLAITGTLDKAFAASPPQCNPRQVSGPVSGPAQNPGQQGQNPGQKGQNAQCQPPPPPLNSEVSGQFSGTTSFSANEPCALIQQTFDATYTASGGTGSFSMDGCLSNGLMTPPTETQQFSGFFTLTAPDGATLRGTVAGSETSAIGIINPSGVALSFTLTPTGGTNEFANVTGVVNLTGDFPLNGGGTSAPIGGSLSGALQ